MRILLVGCGAIGRAVAAGAATLPGVARVFAYDAVAGRAAALASLAKVEVAGSFEAGLASCDLVVEAASQEAAQDVAPRALAAGKDVVLLSVGALADDGFREALVAAALKYGRKVHVPSGAIGALDALRAAREGGLDRVTLTTAKPPASLGLVDVRERRVLFEGSAREAVQRYPKNVNVAAALALAGVGLDRTTVRVVADPALKENTHTIEAEGAFGRFTFRVENKPSPENPATSHLAALAALALLRRLTEPLVVG